MALSTAPDAAALTWSATATRFEVAPSGAMSLQEARLRAMLANCASFRGLTDPALTVTEAYGRIYFEGLPAPTTGDTYTAAELAQLRPFAVIAMQGTQGWDSIATGCSGNTFDWEDSGRLTLSIERTPPSNYGDEPTSNANMDFLNRIGAIVTELKELAGGEEYLGIRRLWVMLGPWWAHPGDFEAEGRWQRIDLGVEWHGVG